MSSRLFCVGIGGLELSGLEKEVLAAHPPYGVILFRRNIESAPQLERLVADVRRLGARFLFLDQEGGPVDRLKDLLGPSPSFQRATRAALARRAGELAGSALALLGFDVDLAPVVDRGIAGAGALVLGERCASEDAGEVVRAGEEFLDGLHSRGVGGCLKHFPGLGRARVDSHRTLPFLDDDAHQEALDLAPFDALMGKAGALMVSHAAGGDGIPASLSMAKTDMLLRERLGFEGAAFSDDLEMEALDKFGTLPERCAAAANAGCDLLLVCRQIEHYPACVEAVERDVPVPRRVAATRHLEAYADGLRLLRTRVRSPELTLAALSEELRSFGAA